jgi:hypothetical protein
MQTGSISSPRSVIIWTALTIAAFFSQGCATRPTGADFANAHKPCTAQADADRRAARADWFTRWIKCRQTHVMPIEIQAIPNKEFQIRNMYAQVLEMGKEIDSGISGPQLTYRLKHVYREWDRMLDEIGLYPNDVCFKMKNATEACVPPGSLTILKKNGELVRIK